MTNQERNPKENLMSENQTKPEYLAPWTCPKCGHDCSGSMEETKDQGNAVGYMLTCQCGCEFIHWESIEYQSSCVEVDGREFEYPQETNPADVSVFVEEYADLAAEFGDINDIEDQASRIIDMLANRHEWTHDSASVLLGLTTKYGTFVLRNALALALALNIDDGTEGL
jgi:hypothetical protein